MISVYCRRFVLVDECCVDEFFFVRFVVEVGVVFVVGGIGCWFYVWGEVSVFRVVRGDVVFVILILVVYRVNI